MSLQPIDLATANRILDFSGGDPALASLAQMQLEGAVAIHNRIADPNIGMAYLADEVGMGKTYVALGLVALMRYFNPSLRVLFICPSNNVQEKWYSREYRSFIGHNVRVNQFRIKTLDGRPAAPRVSCRNVNELIQSASSGYFADFFIGMSAFSIGMTDDETNWRERLQALKTMLPALRLPKNPGSKKSVKDQYAQALNYVLPAFDLVVIDEAHKFKHPFESSDRNRVLSAVLGFRQHHNGYVFQPKVKNALLLSATPYDRNLNHLRNQLNLVGKGALLPDDIGDQDQASTRQHLQRFLVRRLNTLQIAGKPHTRNMYRREWRSGERAEIALESDEQKLVTALVQKKVGEMLDKKGDGASFQTGLLASFESFAQSSRSEPVEFDGEQAEKESSDAQDRHVVAALARSYIDTELGKTLPHPKMDSVTAQLAEHCFVQNRKQIVFVRRVKSVAELKNKLDDCYNAWLIDYLRAQLADNADANALIERVVAEYATESRYKTSDISGGEPAGKRAGDVEDSQTAKNDTLFAWFFRGEPTESIAELLKSNSTTSPEAMRRGLKAKNQSIVSLLEINWAVALCRSTGVGVEQYFDHAVAIGERAGEYFRSELQDDLLARFQAVQLGFLAWYRDTCCENGSHGQATSPQAIRSAIDQLLAELWPHPPQESAPISAQVVKDELSVYTFSDALHNAGLEQLFPRLPELLCDVLAGKTIEKQRVEDIEIHKQLVSLSLRTCHGVIDLYLARLQQGSANLTAETRAAWMDAFTFQLGQQLALPGFSTAYELAQLAEQFDLIVKTNLVEIYDKKPEEYSKYLSQMLNPVAPVVGATGETYGSRSAQARKFRMPGYPLALISTDVFQEGEDLHTFCDSVIHYGLSGSPVGIEQKTGRVDRVASMAQRRLIDIQHAAVIDDEQLIQVTFPFVRQSIEALQVRQLCHNINEFIASMHDIGSAAPGRQDIIETSQALINRSEIPQQIRTLLSSPYNPQLANLAEHNREAIIEEQQAQTTRVIAHITRLLQDRCGRDVLGTATLAGTKADTDLSDSFDDQLNIKLSSARASGEILLCASVEGELLSLQGMQRKQLYRLMREHSWHTLHRTYVTEVDNRSYRLYHDAEMLIGCDQVTTRGEIDDFFTRFSRDHNPDEYQPLASPAVVAFISQAVREQKIQLGNFNSQVRSKDSNTLALEFGQQSLSRQHFVELYEVDGSCIFLARAAPAEVVRGLTIQQIVKLTWQRNAHIDIAEFMLDEEGALVGRAVHPIEGMTYKEFCYCVYTLAAATDRLEYLIHERDRY